MAYFFQCPPERQLRIIAVMGSGRQPGELFAAAHYALTPGFSVKAVIADHCRALQNVLSACGGQGIPLIPGRNRTEAVEFILKEAQAQDTRPLYLCVWGGKDTVAEAYMRSPEAMSGTTVILMEGTEPGGQAEQVLLRGELPLWLIRPVACRQIRVTVSQLYQRIASLGAAGRFLWEQAAAYCADEFLKEAQGEAVWLEPEAAVAVLLAPHEYAYTTEAAGERSIRVYTAVDNRFVLEDLFAKLALYGQMPE